MSQVLCQVLGYGDSKDIMAPILMEFRTSWETETKVKKKCDSAKGCKKKKKKGTKNSELGRSNRR